MSGFPSEPDESASLELVARIQGGDSRAWDELYRRYHDQLLFTVRMRLGSGLRSVLQSEDVFQSVALDALSALKRFEYRGPGSLERYLKQMVLNKIRDRAKAFGAAKRAGQLVGAEAAFDDLAAPRDAEVGYYEAAVYVRLERAIAGLPDEMREVLLLRRIEGLSSLEVAERLGKSDASVRQIASRAMARLATRMAES
ncbi:MAG: sigma-70 family RNA polymerase sigma factor [Planctomycetes bacterium]|nr:sigma-70 family RNA polymerase sigma factor [Planctomycetota bacterium]